MCSPVVHKRAADPTVVSLRNARCCRRHRFRFTLYESFDRLCYDDDDSNSNLQRRTYDVVMVSTFNCIMLQILRIFQNFYTLRDECWIFHFILTELKKLKYHLRNTDNDNGQDFQIHSIFGGHNHRNEKTFCILSNVNNN